MSALRGNAVVTGAGGFVGRVLVSLLGAGARSLSLRGEDWPREAAAVLAPGATVFHLAARVHDPGAAADAYLRDNAEKTRALAAMAADAGARAFVFLSSIKVNGEESRERPFRRDDPPAPEDAYARSKLAAERHLAQIASRSGLAVAVVRAPLVHGAGARGNLAAFLRLADSPWPLPFAAIANRRSFVHVRDLCELLTLCAVRDAARGRTYLAAHREPCSTPELASHLRRALGRPTRLFALPPGLLEGAAAAMGKAAQARRLTRSLEVDPSDAERELGWTAGIAIEAAAREMAAAHRAALDR